MNESEDRTEVGISWIWLCGWVLAAAITRESNLVWLGCIGLLPILFDAFSNR